MWLVCTLPSGKTRIVEAGVTGTVLSDVHPSLGVIDIALNPQTEMSVTEEMVTSINSRDIWGIYKDTKIIDGTDHLNATRKDMYDDNIDRCLVTKVHTGSSVANNGASGFDKLIQFGLAARTKELSIRDTLGHKTGYAYPYL